MWPIMDWILLVSTSVSVVLKGDVLVFGVSANLLIGRLQIFSMLGEECSQGLQKFHRACDPWNYNYAWICDILKM